MADPRPSFRFLSNEEFRKLAPAERAQYIRAVMAHLLAKLKQARAEPAKKPKKNSP